MLIRSVSRQLVLARKLMRKWVMCSALNAATRHATSVLSNMCTTFLLKIRPTYSNRVQIRNGSVCRHLVWARTLMRKQVRCSALNEHTRNATLVPSNMCITFSLKMHPTLSNRPQNMIGSVFRHLVSAWNLMWKGDTCIALNAPTRNATSVPSNLRTMFSLKMRPT